MIAAYKAGIKDGTKLIAEMQLLSCKEGGVICHLLFSIIRVFELFRNKCL